MLADFRFVLGAILAVTMLAVAGLGVVTSVALMREAHIAPAEDSRSLAYAGPITWNEFYDPDAARRFDGGGKSVIEPAAVPTRSPDPLAETVEDKEHADEAPETPPAAAALAADEPAAPPAERIASAPATSVPAAEPAPVLAAELPQAAAPLAEPPPQPRPRPQFHKRARPHIRRAFVARQQAPQYPPFGWQPFGSQFGTRTQHGAPYGTTTAWRNPFGGPFRPR